MNQVISVTAKTALTALLICVPLVESPSHAFEIQSPTQHWLRRPVFDAESSEAYYASAVNTSGSPVRDRMFLHAVSLSSAPPILGDLNGDGDVNLLDVQPFVQTLSSGDYQWAADANSDGSVNLLDVQPFVEILAN